jgi:hypothetical protein
MEMIAIMAALQVDISERRTSGKVASQIPGGQQK